MEVLLSETVSFLKEKGIDKVDCAVVLGTGLGQFINHLEIIKSIPYSEIPHFPAATVESHKGNLIYGKIGEFTVLAMQGRFHYYEGYSMQQITFPVRVLFLMGAKYLLLSNASGGINCDFKKGDLVILDDHINLQTSNPLIGKNMDQLGPRFPDMSAPYSSELTKVLMEAAEHSGVSLKKGVYVAVNGPNLETRAEYRFLKIIGADMVGMSTVPEVLVANHMGMPCAAVSVITDECDPDNLKPVDISEIIAVAEKADEILSQIFVKALTHESKA